MGGNNSKLHESGQLLNYNGVDERKSQSSEENESRDNKGSINKRVEKLSKVVPLPVSEPETEEQRNELHNDHDQEKGKDVEKKGEVVEVKTEKVKSAGSQLEIKLEEANAKHGSSDDEDEDDEEEEEDEDDDIQSGRLIGPGSPSFKIYCIEVDNKKEEELCENENQTIAMLQKSPSANSVESSASPSGNSNKILQTIEFKSVPKRKGKKKKKFGLHVKHLRMNRMNPLLACTGNDRRRLRRD
ncbi:nucleolin protein [Spatholobus suberectus]|nr:nucleolin protein [Spatholobus suberectus]